MRLLCCLLLLNFSVIAQELTTGVSGTGLGKGVFSFRTLNSFKNYQINSDKYTHYHQINTFALGINSRLTLMGHLPFHTTSGSKDYDARIRLGDPLVMAKLRILQLDSDTINTTRLSLLIAAELPSTDAEISSNSLDPVVGFGLTTIQGRHGINLACKAKINTGNTPYYEFSKDDYLETVLGYSWRLTPSTWDDYTHVSTYFFTEFIHNSDYSSEQSLTVSPGYLIEARDFAIEIALHLPLMDQGSTHNRLDFGMTIGIRYLF